ncbi:hypothetical protein [Streptomyces iconiensis]|uniref:Uncharacterized protein n=1 Tax=Streptomyces iconiensis TaxID=1384038 RepID=A0ABT7A2T7_9ACTN|nr:hypothetical protein [Streptomyces iconiensis]MDJ1135649.1 hypothetical protein [Streptomyces iconiensis]
MFPFINRSGTITPRLALIRRMAEFTGLYSWHWTPAEAEAFTSHLRSGPKPIMVSTTRGYEIPIQMFCAYISDSRYGWLEEREQRFGTVPQQVFHEWNTVLHVAEYEGDPRSRPLHYDEVQRLFDAADGRAEQIRARRMKGSVSAIRGAALVKTLYAYAYGLRRQESRGLDLVDLRRTPTNRSWN